MLVLKVMGLGELSWKGITQASDGIIPNMEVHMDIC
jgi:hypothetical protein